MTGSNRIVSGIDLGPDTERVLSYTACVAARTGASVKLLYVIDYLLTPPSYLASYVEEEKRRDEAEMAELKARLGKEGIDAEYAIVLGRLHESFSKVIGESSPGLVVLGYKSHALRPSSSEKLIRSLKIPMLVVRGRASEDASLGKVEIRNILCPVDFSENSGKALSAAMEYAALFGASIRLVHVIPSYLIKEKWSVWQKLESADRENFDAAMHAEAESAMESLCREFGMTGGMEIIQGSPAEIIVSLARDGKYDLVVMGARGLSYIQATLIGSTTDAVLKSSPCPVLIVH